jgi:hypothetical protein
VQFEEKKEINTENEEKAVVELKQHDGGEKHDLQFA